MELVVTHPLVNILRGAMSILVAVVSHPHTPSNTDSQPDSFGFAALKPAIGVYPQFLEMLVSRLSVCDHSLCANALQLINSLMREAIINDSEADWPKFIKRLSDLGVIKAVYALMQSTALQDLAHPTLEFQSLQKVLLQKWRNVPLDIKNKMEHRRALKCLHLASNPEPVPGALEDGDESTNNSKRRPEKWRRLGFESETPSWEFEETGYLGMMDLTHYVRGHEDNYQKILLEQSTKPWEDRCPVARAALAVTALLYDHFEIDKAEPDDAKGHVALESRTGFEKVFKPLLLQWPRLHVSGLQAFLRLWKATGAKKEDFVKIVDLVRVLIEVTVGSASRTKDLKEVEDEMEAYQLSELRKTQMELLELAYEDTWGHHLRQVKDELNHEALQFVKEQRIRCLLQGAWFPNGLGYKAEAGPVTKQDLKRSVPSSFRFAKLSHNRRYLHYADFESQSSDEPELEALSEKRRHPPSFLNLVFEFNASGMTRLTCFQSTSQWCLQLSPMSLLIRLPHQLTLSSLIPPNFHLRKSPSMATLTLPRLHHPWTPAMTLVVRSSLRSRLIHAKRLHCSPCILKANLLPRSGWMDY